MNGINGIRNGYNHLNALSTQNNDLSFNPKAGVNTVLPSITNLNNVTANISFNSYLNSDSIPLSTNVVSHSNLMGNEYQNSRSIEYSLPFPHINNQQYYNSTSNNNNIHYQYQQDFNYAPLLPNNPVWMDTSAYSNECLKPPVPSFPVSHSADSYRLNGISPHSNPGSGNGQTKDVKIVCNSKQPAHSKDEKYSVRRQKNNIAAKKCRDNKKQKNQEVCDLIMRYEKENDDLKSQIHSVKSKIEELVKQLRR